MPLVPGSEGRLASVDDARRMASDVGYPVLLKAASGGGGRGMRPVAEPAELETAYATATAEAEAAFGDGGLYLEKIVLDAHHVEVQVVGDGEGGALVVGERECSVQRRHQKLLEESPSPFVSGETRGGSTTPPSVPCARRATATRAPSNACSAAISRSTSWR
jgi:acetyl-CoA carboxylase biotin carboxylase subunit